MKTKTAKSGMWMYERIVQITTPDGKISTPIRFPVEAVNAKAADKLAPAISTAAWQALAGDTKPDWTHEPVRLYKM